MGSESRDIESALDGVAGEPLFGRAQKRAAFFPPETEYRYFVGTLDEPEERAELERLMTASMRGQAAMKKPGDICVVSETGSFDKEGRYHVVVKYLCLPDKPEKKGKARA